MFLRPATLDDAEQLLIRRNDPTTRANSIDTEPVPPEVHTRWLASVLNNPARDLLLAELDGEAVGTIRIDHSAAFCELSWTIAPKWRRRGLGRSMVAMVLAMDRTRGRPIQAKIRLDNNASKQIVQALGFIKIANQGNVDVWIYGRKALPEAPRIVHPKPNE